MYFHMKQRLRAWTGLPPCLGVSRSRYHQAAYRTLTNQNLVNRRPTKTTVQIWAGEGSRSCQRPERKGVRLSPPSPPCAGHQARCPVQRVARGPGRETRLPHLAKPPWEPGFETRQAQLQNSSLPPSWLPCSLRPCRSRSVCGKAVSLPAPGLSTCRVGNRLEHLCQGSSFGELRPSEELPP